MKPDKLYENKILSTANRLGCFAKHMTCGINGWPDIDISRGYFSAKIEVKVCHDDAPIRDTFTDGQVPFYIRYTEKASNLFVMYDNGTESRVFMVDHTLAVKMLNMTIGECYDQASVHYYGTIDECIQYLFDVLEFRCTFKD